jgi:hypothetical protein
MQPPCSVRLRIQTPFPGGCIYSRRGTRVVRELEMSVTERCCSDTEIDRDYRECIAATRVSSVLS